MGTLNAVINCGCTNQLNAEFYFRQFHNFVKFGMLAMANKQKVAVELYVPKGGMCTACKKKHENCSKLEFEKMQIVNTFRDTAFVKCTEFEREAI